MQTLILLSMLAACIMAGYSAQQGLATSTSDKIVSVGVAVAGALFIFVFCHWMVKKLPKMDATRQKYAWGAMVVVMVLAFGFSTQWSVIAIGGKSAMSTHIQTTLTEADTEALKLYRQASVEANMAPQLEGLSQQYNSLSEFERGGGFSGLTGGGEVVGTLQSTSQLFANAARTIKTVGRDKEELYDQYKKLSDNGRKIASAIEATDMTEGDKVRQLSLEFAGNLGEINRVLTRMRETSARTFVEQINKNLSTMTMVPKEGIRPEQKAAIERLATTMKGAQNTVGEILAAGQGVGEVAPQTFMMISPARAVWQYPGEVSFAWAAGVTLDLIPFMFVFLARLSWKEDEEEQTEEVRQATGPRRAIG